MTRIAVRNPWDQSVVAEVAYHTATEVESIVARAVTAQRTWREQSIEQRQRIVRDGIAKMNAMSDAVARDVSLQMGKPLAQARGEFQTMLARAEQSLRDAPLALMPDDLSSPGFVRKIQHEPLGVVFNMAAWNYPLLIPINVLIPALLAGNVVILKHSARTPLTGRSFAEAFGHLEIPHLVSDIVLSHEHTEALISDSRIAHVAFTGSVAGGEQIYRAVASRFIDAGLELGGKDAAYVAADADLARAIDGIVDGACYNAGQSCCAVERAYVHESLYADFLQGCREQLAKYVLGDPLQDSTTLGPLAIASSLELFERQIGESQQRGARVIFGGQRASDVGTNFFQPTLVADVPNNVALMQEETFGPLLPVQSVHSDEEAIARMNDCRFGLTASVWTQDTERAERCAQQLEAGVIFQNRCDYIDPMLPWTGWKESGKGSTLSRYGYYHLTRRKALHLRA